MKRQLFGYFVVQPTKMPYIRDGVYLVAFRLYHKWLKQTVHDSDFCMCKHSYDQVYVVALEATIVGVMCTELDPRSREIHSKIFHFKRMLPLRYFFIHCIYLRAVYFA